MKANKKVASFVMVLGVLITALWGNGVTAKAALSNTYKWVADSDGNYVDFDVSSDFSKKQATWVTGSSAIKDSASFESSDGKKTISFTTSSTYGQKVTQDVAERSFSNIQSQIASSGLQTTVMVPIKQFYNSGDVVGYSGWFDIELDGTPLQYFTYNIFQAGTGDALTLAYGFVDTDDSDMTKYVTFTPHFADEDSDSLDSDTGNSDILDSDSGSSETSDSDSGSSETSSKPSVKKTKKIKTISEKTLYNKARKGIQHSKYIKIKVKQIRYTGISGYYYVKSTKGYVYSWFDDAYNIKEGMYTNNKHIKPKKGKTYTVYVSQTEPPKSIRKHGCKGSVKGVVWELAIVNPITK